MGGVVVGLSAKHRVFVEEYLKTWNATDAYCAAYPKSSRESARRDGSRLLTNADIADAIRQRIAERTMQADEVLLRLAEHARGDIVDFLAVSEGGDVAFDISKAPTKTHLIKRVTQRKTIRTTEKSQIEEVVLTFELHDAQAALVHIGKHHRLFTDGPTGDENDPIHIKMDI